MFDGVQLIALTTGAGLRGAERHRSAPHTARIHHRDRIAELGITNGIAEANCYTTNTHQGVGICRNDRGRNRTPHPIRFDSPGGPEKTGYGLGN